MQILQPSGWARPRGYSNGVATRGTMVFVAGMCLLVYLQSTPALGWMLP